MRGGAPWANAKDKAKGVSFLQPDALVHLQHDKADRPSGRGLAHPAVMRGVAPRAGADKDKEEDASFLQPEVMRSLYATFGAVPATPRNIFRLFKVASGHLLFVFLSRAAAGLACTALAQRLFARSS